MRKATVGKEELRLLAGERPWGNFCDKRLNFHVHLSIVKQVDGIHLPALYFSLLYYVKLTCTY